MMNTIDNFMKEGKIKMIQKTEIEIRLTEMMKVYDFVKTCGTFESSIDVSSMNNRYIVDGKSLLGILGLDLSKNVRAILFSNNEDEINRFTTEMEKFAC